MRNYIFALIAVFALYSCNSDQSSTSGDSSTADAPTGTEQANPVTPDPNMPDPNTINPDMPPEPEPGNAKFEFEKTEHDFGKITQESNVDYTFKFKNTGTEPLIISDARGSCGCTVPEYSREPIPVGATGEIQVSFDPKGKTGMQRKTVTITANTNPTRTTLNIVSEIEGGTEATPQ